MADDEKMEVEQVLEGLERVLVLQNRTVLQFSIASSSIFGLAYQSLADTIWGFARDELVDLRQLVEKVVAIGGTPPNDVAPLEWSGEAEQVVDRLIEIESEVIDELKAVIPHTGDEGRSEALEHLIEHVIMRKQNQVDFLLRARRAS